MNVEELYSSGGRREDIDISNVGSVYTIAKAVGHPPPSIDRLLCVSGTGQLSIQARLLLDLEHGRPMKLEVALGNPLKRAKEHNIPTPILNTLSNGKSIGKSSCLIDPWLPTELTHKDIMALYGIVSLTLLLVGPLQSL